MVSMNAGFNLTLPKRVVSIYFETNKQTNKIRFFTVIVSFGVFFVVINFDFQSNLFLSLCFNVFFPIFYSGFTTAIINAFICLY